MDKNIGHKIKYMRQPKNLSQYALATEAGVAQSTLSCIEKGARTPRFEARQIHAPHWISLCSSTNMQHKTTALRAFIAKTPGASLLFSRTQPSGICNDGYTQKELPSVNVLSVCESESLI